MDKILKIKNLLRQIRLNQSHPRFRVDAIARRSRFVPVRIRGGSISKTVLDDRG